MQCARLPVYSLTMEEKEVELRLRTLQSKAKELLHLLAQDRLTLELSEKIELLARALKQELHSEDEQVSRRQRRSDLTFAESGIYNPSIHEAFTAISSLRVDGTAKKAWYDKFDEVRYKLGKYLRSASAPS